MNEEIQKLVSFYKKASGVFFVALFYGIPFLSAVAFSVYISTNVLEDEGGSQYIQDEGAIRSGTDAISYQKNAGTYNADGSLYSDVALPGITDVLPVDVAILGGKISYTGGVLLSEYNKIYVAGQLMPPVFSIRNERIDAMTGDNFIKIYKNLISQNLDNTTLPAKPNLKKLVSVNAVQHFGLECLQKMSKNSPLCRNKIDTFIAQMPYYDVMADPNFIVIAEEIVQTNKAQDFCDAYLKHIYHRPWNERSRGSMDQRVRRMFNFANRCDNRTKEKIYEYAEFAYIINDFEKGFVNNALYARHPLFQIVTAQSTILSSQTHIDSYINIFQEFLESQTIGEYFADASYVVHEVFLQGLDARLESNRFRNIESEFTKLTQGQRPGAGENNGLRSKMATPDLIEADIQARDEFIAQPQVLSARDLIRRTTDAIPAYNQYQIDRISGDIFTVEGEVTIDEEEVIPLMLTAYIQNNEVYISAIETEVTALNDAINMYIDQKRDVYMNEIILKIINDYQTYVSLSGQGTACREYISLYRRIPKTTGHECVDERSYVRLKVTGDNPYALTIQYAAGIVTSVNATLSGINSDLQQYANNNISMFEFATIIEQMIMEKNDATTLSSITSREINTINALFDTYMRTDDVRILSKDEDSDRFAVEFEIEKFIFRAILDLNRNNIIENIQYLTSGGRTINIDIKLFLIARDRNVLSSFIADPLTFIQERDSRAAFAIARAI